jgi:pyruvate dehydrogenase E2 component (dihydrolipoamide acetyltransferase)
VEAVEIMVKIGDTVTAGQTIGSFEADKAVVELAAPVDGRIESIHLNLGQRVPVGTPFITLRTEHNRQRDSSYKDAKVAEIRRLPAQTRRPQTTFRGRDVVFIGVTAIRGRAKTVRNSKANWAGRHKSPR